MVKMDKIKIREVTVDEVLRRLENGENLDNYRVIGSYKFRKGYWALGVRDVKINDLFNALIIEIYT